MAFKQYDVVRILGFVRPVAFALDPMNRRAPRVGDVATVVEVYEQPRGYELECSTDDGTTEWLLAFETNDVELEAFEANASEDAASPRRPFSR